MRYLVILAFLFSACTRANPDAVAGGGSGGGGGGAAGGGGGGVAGGGGTGGGNDLSAIGPEDMRATGPADMTSFAGVFCGNTVCMAPANECCAATNNTLTCIPPAQLCNGNSYDCDGPEDCKTTQVCCGGGTGSTCNDVNGGGCQGGRVPLCHTLDDCPKSNGGYAGCCLSPQGGHIHFCSKNPC